ncbi:hypothetical protein EDD15DRAFT_2195895 [Pisolithus albus]|nr:hypothetical protein EDD15DRAFT_2195895 [Pisolithus albus]
MKYNMVKRNRTNLSLCCDRPKHTVYRHKALVELAASARKSQQERLERMGPEECQALEALREETDRDWDCEWEDTGDMALGDVLDGTKQLELQSQRPTEEGLSHAVEMVDGRPGGYT